MPEDSWADLAEAFVDHGYGTVKGQVRTYVLHEHLLRHLPPPPATVLDVGGGAANQSLPLARLGYRVTVLDPSEAMLARAQQRVSAEDDAVQRRVRLVRADGAAAQDALGGETFDAVLCHGVLMYLSDTAPLLDAVCRSLAPDGVLSIMTLNARTLASRPALEGRWGDALEAFDATEEVGTLGVPTRGDTVEALSRSLEDRGVAPVAWYGVWLFADWLDLPADSTDLQAVAAVELQASMRDPYRAMSRVFHPVGRRS